MNEQVTTMITALEPLLSPIAAKFPCGTNLRLTDNNEEPIYHQLRENRNQARIAEKNLSNAGNELFYTQRNTYWDIILKQAPNVLATQSKDIEIACWLLEAAFRAHGMEGLAAHLWFLNAILQQYWENLYPPIDEEDLENRVACIQGLNGYSNEGALIAPIYMLSIVPDTSYEKISTWDYLQAKNVEKLADQALKEERYKTGIKSLEQLQTIIKGNDKSFYTEQLVTIELAKQYLDTLTKTLDTLCGKDAPSLKNIKDALTHVHTAITNLTKTIFKDEENDVVTAVSVADLSDEIPTRSAATHGLASSREEALRKLDDAANYFYMYEPHSPISFVIKKILRWSQMDLAELIPELIREPSTQMDLSWLLGLEPTQEVRNFSDADTNPNYGE